MTEDPDGRAGRRVGLPEPAWPAGDELPGAALPLGLDLADITRMMLAATVPGFAEGAGVFVLERLLKGGEATVGEPPVGETAGPETAGPETARAEMVGGQVVARRLGTRFAHMGQRLSAAAFPPGQVIAFAASSPLARCVASGRPVTFGAPDDRTLERLRPGGREVLSGCNSFLAVPLATRDTIIGFGVFARDPGVSVFGRRDIEAAARLGVQAGTGIANALTLMRHRSIADAFQRGLLAATPVVPSGLEVAGRCLPAAGHVIGGDWYDVIPLSGDRTGLVVGDVMGHGAEAAAVMAQLRAAAHALADLDLAPAELLQRLNRSTAMLRRITLATCAYAVIDPGSHSCTLAGAGHLPPILALSDGATRVPELPAGQSLGIGTASYGQARIKLPPGAVLALYTDGLVESRTRAFDQGIVALRSALARERGDLEDICDALVALLAGPREDDITLVLARIPAAV